MNVMQNVTVKGNHSIDIHRLFIFLPCFDQLTVIIG
jgi:hypothetical protein